MSTITETKTISLKKVSSLIQAIENCKKSGNKEWEEKHTNSLNETLKQLPHGSGIDGKHEILLSESNPNRIVFTLEFHHMNDGYYDGWTKHTYIITPEFGGFDIRITGRDKNDIKDYLSDMLYDVFEG